MATPVADPLTAVDPQADLGFAAGVTLTQSGSRVQNADGSEVWIYTVANYTEPASAEVVRLQNAVVLYAAPHIKVASEKVVCALETTQLTLTSYLGDVPTGNPNTTASFTEDEMVAELKKNLTAMRDLHMVGGGDPEFVDRSGSTFDFRISGVDRNTLSQVVLDTIMDYTIQETATNLSLTPESISGNTVSPPKEAGATLTIPTLADIDLRLNSGAVTIAVDNPMIGDMQPSLSASPQFPGICTVEVAINQRAIVVTPINPGTVQVGLTLEMVVFGPGGIPDIEQAQSSFNAIVNNDGLPVATLNGDPAPEVEWGGIYTEAGYTNPNPTADQTIATTGAVMNSTPGDYTLTYSFTNGFGTTTLTRVVTVLPEPPDTTPPVINILGNNPETVEVGEAYTDAGATAGFGETVTSTGNVDTSTLGDYTITYSATDAAGNTGTATRTVTVQDTVSPVITLVGANPVNLTEGDTYTEAGATATDNSGEAISVVPDSSAVDTSAAGTYTVTYSATDSSGNQGTATRSVVVALADPSNQSIAVTVAGGVFQFSPSLTELNYGYTYTFDQSDSTNSGHPLRFSTVSDGTHGDGIEISYRLTYATSGDATNDQATINGIDLTTYGSSSLNPTATAITRARVTGDLIFVKQTMTGYGTGSFGSAQRTEAISVMNGVGTNLNQVEVLEVVGGVPRTHGITIGADSIVYEVPNTTPTTMHYYCQNHSGMGNSLTVGYPSTTPVPSAYTIHWTDPEELFPSIIDMDTVNQGIVRIQNIFDQTSSRRPGAESLVYDTHMEFVGDQTINSAATGGPTNFPQTMNMDLEMWDITGWVEEGRVTWKTLGSTDGLLAFSGRPRNTTELTTAHEVLHALGVGSLNTGSYAINGQDALVRSPVAGQPALWLGTHSTSLYTTTYANAITDGDVTATPEGVPLKYEDLTHFNDSSDNRRGAPFTINSKEYVGMWNEIVTATGGDYIAFSGAMLKDFGLPVVISQLEPMPAPTVAKTYDFDVSVTPGGEYRLAPSTTANVGNVYSRAWNNTDLTGVDNANIHIQWNDVVILHTGALGTSERMNVYNPGGYNTSGAPWESLTPVEAWSGGDQSIIISPGSLQAAEDARAALVPETPNTVEGTGDWMNYFVRYSNTADPAKFGYIKLVQQGKELVDGGDGDWDADGVKDVNDPHHPDFLNSINLYSGGAPQSSGLLFQASDTNYFANTVGSQDYPLNVTTAADEPWALSTSFVYRRRRHAFLNNSDSGVVLFSLSHPSATSNIHTTGSNSMLQLSMHENQYTGSVFARFTVGTQTDNVVITSPSLNYNYLYNGVYVDYDGAGTYRMYTYDYNTQTLSLVPGSGVVSTGSWNGVHSSEHLVVGKNLGEDVYWHGRLSHLSMTTLSHDVPLPGTTEVEKFIKDPFQWVESYRQGEQFRMPGDTSNLVTTSTVTPDNTEIYIDGNFMYIEGSLTVDQGGSDIAFDLQYGRQTVFNYNTGGQGGLNDYGDLRLTTVSPQADLSGAQDPANIITDGVTYTSNSQIVLSANTITHPIPSTVYIVDLTSAAAIPAGPENGYVFTPAVRNTNPYRGVLSISGSGDFTGSITSAKTFAKADLFVAEGSVTTDQVNSATATKVWHFGRTLVNGPGGATEENLVAYNKSEHDLVKN